MIKVTVIVPVFNAELYLEKCITSLINQTYKNIEIIFIDDGSTDNSINIIKKYIKKDNRIKLLVQENMGASIARINGLKDSSGDYIMFVDSDDYIVNNTVEILVNKINKYDVDIVKFRFLNKKTFRCIVKERMFNEPDKKFLYRKLLTTRELNNLTTEIVRKKIINIDSKNFKIRMSSGEDLLMNLEIYNKAKTVLIIHNKLYFYTINNNSTTQTNNKEKIFSNIYENKDAHQILLKYAQKWKLTDNKIKKKILLRYFNSIFLNLTKLLQSNKLEQADYNKINYIIDNYEVVNKLKKQYLFSNLKNKRIIKLILNKKYGKAIKKIKAREKQKKFIKKIQNLLKIGRYGK